MVAPARAGSCAASVPTRPAASTVSPIGIYNDDVFLNNVYLQAFPLFDVERVEVLRGPQGTLWGKNTTGGAIHFLSKKPGFDTDGYARLGYGTVQEQLAQGGLGGPIVKDLVAGRVAFYTEKRDGWVFNEATGRNYGTLFDAAARAQLLITPTDNFEAHVIAKLRRLDAEKNPRFRVTNPVRADDLKNPAYAGPMRTDVIAQEGISQDLFDTDGGSVNAELVLRGPHLDLDHGARSRPAHRSGWLVHRYRHRAQPRLHPQSPDHAGAAADLAHQQPHQLDRGRVLLSRISAVQQRRAPGRRPRRLDHQRQPDRQQPRRLRHHRLHAENHQLCPVRQRHGEAG